MMTDKVAAYRKCDDCMHLKPSHVGGYRTVTAYWRAAKERLVSLYRAGLPLL